MIKRLLVLFLGILFYGQIGAQKKEFTPEWNIGVGFGPTFSSLSIIPTYPVLSVKTKSVSQFHGGVAVRYITEKNLGFIAELNYSQMGWEENFEGKEYELPDGTLYPGADTIFQHTHKLNYLEIPFLTHIYFGGNKVRGFFNIGPKIGLLLSESESINEKLREYLNQEPDPNKAAIGQYGKKADKKIDYGLTAGAGVELRTGIGSFALEGRYYMGFGDIYNNRKSDYFSRSANRVISAKLTYYIKAF